MTAGVVIVMVRRPSWTDQPYVVIVGADTVLGQTFIALPPLDPANQVFTIETIGM